MLTGLAVRIVRDSAMISIPGASCASRLPRMIPLLLTIVSCDTSTNTDPYVELRLAVEGIITETTPTGEPIAGAEVELGSTLLVGLMGTSKWLEIEIKSSSSESGYYRLEKQVSYFPGRPCPFWINARSPGYAEVGAEVVKLHCVSDVQHIDLVLIPSTGDL
jgi:hypothetical protein